MTKHGESKSTFIGAAQRVAVLVMALAVLIGTSAATAAASTGSTIVVKVPFAFTVGSSTLPAGDYTLTDKGNDVVQIRGSDANVLVRAWKSDSDESTKGATLVFHRYGDRYFLAGMQSFDDAKIVRTGRSGDEERLAKSGAKPQVVTVARAAR